MSDDYINNKIETVAEKFQNIMTGKRQVQI